MQALDSGKVFSCGLDVYENEPEVHPGLVDNRNVMLVPHMGTWTAEVCTRTTLMICHSRSSSSRHPPTFLIVSFLPRSIILFTRRFVVRMRIEESV